MNCFGNNCAFLLLLALLPLLFRECTPACSGSTCDKCVSSSYSCSWCTQKNFTEPRCNLKETLVSTGCAEDEIDDPKGQLRLVQNSEVRDGTSADPKAVQVKPQVVEIKTRPREEHSLTMTFRAAKNFPVDLYFLFDNSVSMNNTIRSLAKLADDIGKAIGDISTNYKMAYGVFQDKVILPFTDTSPQRLVNPCIGGPTQGIECAPPFEFRHLLDMTHDLRAFKAKIEKSLTELSGNIDHPEGSLDAIMQAIMCKSDIGWRDNSRKLLIFASDGPFKTAGAGKLAGIVTPNDGQCHMNDKGEYSMELEQDYPSVSQLTDAVDASEMHIIFAVTKNRIEVFDKLHQRIPHSVVEPLADGTKTSNQNIKEIIEHKYKEMLSEVVIVHNNVTGVDIQIRAMSPTCQIQGTNKCKGLEIGKEIEFHVDVKVTECPEKASDRKKKVIIYPDFLKTDTLELDIEIICDCDCHKDSTTWEPNSDVCSGGNGTLKCGQCECNQGRYGQFCQCGSADVDSSSSNCIRPDQNSTVCSDAGTCKCGECQCDEGFSGKHCQCNDKACGSYQREVCGGARGRCVCGKCECEIGFTGNACECPTSEKTCIQDGVVCSGVGTCKCGQCVCDKKYTGAYCQNCFLCGKDPCDVDINRACAQCALFGGDCTGCPEEDRPPTELVNSVSGMEGSRCSIKQSDGCFLDFVAVVTEDANITLYVQKTKTCPQPVDIVPIIAGLVGGVVAIGILLLILWKILTSLFDKIEYSKFQEEVKNCKWAQQDNPFYKGATTTYKNPMLDTSQPLD